MALPLGFSPVGLATFVLLTFVICTTVNTFAMEAAVLFVPAFLFVYPEIVPAFPNVPLQAAIGLALFVELFGYSSSVAAYWFRGQVDLDTVKAILAVSVPVAVLGRATSYLAPPALLKILFGGMLLVLSAILFETHREGSSIPDWLTHPRFARIMPERDERAERTDGGVTISRFDWFDRTIAALGGAMAGLVGIAIGELSQTLLTVRKRVPIRLSTGTSAFVLHGTIIAALTTNLVLLQYGPSWLSGHSFSVPFGFGLVAGTTCLVGGQAGAFLNSRIPEERTIQAMTVVYSLVGAFTILRILFLG